MRRWIGRALLVAGGAALAAGIANVLLPSAAFPSSMTCVTDWDTVLCNIEPWAAGPWVALAGALAVAVAVNLLRRRPPAEGTGQERRTS